MADDKEMMFEYSVKSLFSSFCESLVKQEEYKDAQQWQTKLLSVPNHLHGTVFKDRDRVKRHLFKTAYDLILLRRSEWYHKWCSPLTPECRCLEYGYHLQQHGQRKEAERLMHLIDSETMTTYTHANNILTFLSILSNINTVTQPNEADTTNSTYTMYPNDVFEAVPGTVSLRYEPDKFLTRFPGTGLMGFCTQKDLREDLQSHDSTLFGGLTHSTTPTVNTTLHIPSLSDQDPPDIMDRLLSGSRSYSTILSPVPDSINDSGIQSDSVIDLIDRVDVIDEAPPTSWEGQLEHTTLPYLSEAGPEAFHHSYNAYLSLISRVSGIETTPTATPYSYIRKRPLDSVTLLMKVLRDCELICDSIRPRKTTLFDGISKNYFDCVCSILNVCRVKIDQLQADKECSDFRVQLKARGVRRLVGFAEQLLTCCIEDLPNGRDILNWLYQLCLNNEGLPTYRLMLGVWLQAIKPYLSGIEVWVFSGQYIDVLGIVSNDVAKEARDHTYWLHAFTLDRTSVPGCFSSLAPTILNIGRSLNLLSLICPKHHLCNGQVETPKLAFVESLHELMESMKVFREYKQSMELMEEMNREQRMAEMEKERMLAMEPVIKARRKAQQFMDDIKQRELEQIELDEEKKRTLLEEQKKEMEMNEAYRVEMDAIEKEELQLIKEQEVSAKEKEMIEEMKGDLIEYYQRLSKGAELRLARAKWRAKRFALATERLLQHNTKAQDNRETIEGSEDISIGSGTEGETIQVSGDFSMEEGTIKGSGDTGIGSGTGETIQGSEDFSMEEGTIKGSGTDGETIQGSEDFSIEGTIKGSGDIGIGSGTEGETIQGSGDISLVSGTEGSGDKVDEGSEDDGEAPDRLCNYSGDEPIVVETINEKINDVNQKGAVPIADKPHPSQSTVQELLYTATEHVTMVTSRGEAPSSTIQDIMYPDKDQIRNEPTGGVVNHQNTRGEAPSSTIQDIMYPSKGRTRSSSTLESIEEDIQISSGEGSGDEFGGPRNDSGGSGEGSGRSGNYFVGSGDDLAGSSEGSSVRVSIGSLSGERPSLEGSGDGKQGSGDEDLSNVEGSEDIIGKGTTVFKEPVPSDHEEDVTSPQPYKKYSIDFSLSANLPHADILNAPPTSIDHALHLCSLDTLIELCLFQPISMQSDLVNMALVNYFVNELDIKGHFRNLKNFLFLEDGEFSNVLLSALFEKLIFDVSVAEISSLSFLQPLLTSALDQSHSHHLIPILELKPVHQPTTIQSASVKALNFLQVLYKVDWPMNIVIQQHNINQYNEVFHFMLEIKRCSWLLKHVFLKLSKGFTSIPSVQLRLIHAQRQELQHFVTVMESYLTNQIFNVSWKRFESNIEKVSSLDDLIRCHDDYLREVLSKCLLISKTQSVLKLIEECLGCVIKFSAQFLSTNQFKPAVLSAVFKKFRSISSLLLKVISKLIERGYQPHLEDLLLRMNFNKYYNKH